MSVQNFGGFQVVIEIGIETQFFLSSREDTNTIRFALVENNYEVYCASHLSGLTGDGSTCRSMASPHRIDRHRLSRRHR